MLCTQHQPPSSYPPEYLRQTIQVWQPHFPNPLTMDDAREIADTVLNLYDYLLEIKTHAAVEKTP